MCNNGDICAMKQAYIVKIETQNDALKQAKRSVEEQLEYAKTIIQDLLDNSDEYARQRAMDFLEEN